MGKKADALEEELDIERAEKRQYKELLLAEERETARLRELLAVAAGGQSTAIVRGPSPQRDDEDDGEVSLRTEEDVSVTDARVAITELRNPRAPAPSAETLTDIVRANNNERSALQTSQRRANALISRVASALRVTTWDDDGTEILDAAQRFASFAHWLGKRISSFDKVITEDQATVAVRRDEGNVVLAALVAPAELARYIRERQPAKVTTETVATATAAPAELAPFLQPITRDDVLRLRDAAAVYATERSLPNQEWLAAAARSDVAVKELCALVNLLLIPTLARQKNVVTPPAA